MSDQSDHTDRRGTARTPITLVVEYEGASDMIEDYTSNLSVGGTFVHTERELAQGTAVDLVLSFPGLLRPIQLSGVVRWTSRGGQGQPNGVGIEFTGHDEVARARLQSLIQAIERGDPRFVGRVVTVLVVEENPHIAQLIRDGLHQSSRRGFGTRIAFEFTSAEDGQQALDVLNQAPGFDAVICDMVLPVVDGPEVIRALRASPVHGHTPVIAVCASADEQTLEVARAAGCQYLVGKPLKLRALLDAMALLLGESRPGP